MTVAELLPTLKSLNHKEKILAIQFLANEVAKEENLSFEKGKIYEVWSPFDSYKAAEQLNALLKKGKVDV